MLHNLLLDHFCDSILYLYMICRCWSNCQYVTKQLGSTFLLIDESLDLFEPGHVFLKEPQVVRIAANSNGLR
jgi:hypothetical protein